MNQKEIFNASIARAAERTRRKASQELVAKARKYGPAPGEGGRPPVEEPRDYRATVRFSEREQALIEQARQATGESFAEFIRNVAIAKAEKLS